MLLDVLQLSLRWFHVLLSILLDSLNKADENDLIIKVWVNFDEDLDRFEAALRRDSELVSLLVDDFRTSRLEVSLNEPVMRISNSSRHHNANVVPDEVLPLEPKQVLNLLVRVYYCAHLLSSGRDDDDGGG